MHERLARARARVRRFIEDSAWLPLAARTAGIAAGLLLLAAVGMGWLDRTLDLGPPRAEAAADPPSARAASRRSATPSRSETDRPLPSASASAARPPEPPGKVVLNSATEAELERLPGVGPAKAAAIVALRTKLGGKFKRFEDLLRVRGIKRRSLERIRQHAILDAPPPDQADAGPPSPPRTPAASSAPSSAPSAAPPW